MTTFDKHPQVLTEQVWWFNILLNPPLPEVAAFLQSQQSGMHMLATPVLDQLCSSAG